ncbi:MAG: tRNA lysidine(34) synthetase TilS [Enterocloster sp.]
MDRLEQKARKTISEYGMLEKGSRVLAALSGGADSVCLLSLLVKLREEFELDVRAVHVHHGLRGAEADRDAEFARILCEKLSVPCHIIKVDVRSFAAEKGMSEEEAGRYLRYQALEREADGWEADGWEAEERESAEQESDKRESGCGPAAVRIAVAHHSGDQAETILHNLFRGSGLAGLRGIPYVRGRIIRPLLECDRKEIMSWLEAQGLEHIQDSTNSSDHYTRNRIRSRILPAIEADVNRGAVGNILRMGKAAAMADAYLEDQAESWIRANVRASGGGEEGADTDRPRFFGIPLKPFLLQADIIRFYVVMKLLRELSGSARDLGWVHGEQVLMLADRQVGRSVDLPYGLRAVREYEEIRLETAGEERRSGGEKGAAAGCWELEFKTFSYENGQEFPKNRYTKWFDCDKIKGTPVVRTRKQGDYITLSDGSRKTLKRFMIDEKIPRQQRDEIPLLADGSHVMWIIGYRISGYYKIGSDTKQVLQARLVLPDMAEE